MPPMNPRGFLTEEEKENMPKVTFALIKRIMSYLTPYWAKFLLVFVTIIVSSVLGLLPSIITGRIVDEALVGKDMAGYLIYGDVAYDVSVYKKVFEEAAKENKIVQFSLQPSGLSDLMSITQNDKRYVSIAKTLESFPGKKLIRFACEMNDSTSHWYTED